MYHIMIKEDNADLWISPICLFIYFTDCTERVCILESSDRIGIP